jgi:hypothetical protein
MTDLQGSLPVDDEVFQALIGDRDANAADFLSTNFYLDLSGVVDEDTIISVGDVKWNTFVRLFT